ncbi:hypothetical protein BH23CHL2_BH23CHL2_04500 [soil metagenome]
MRITQTNTLLTQKSIPTIKYMVELGEYYDPLVRRTHDPAYFTLHRKRPPATLTRIDREIFTGRTG